MQQATEHAILLHYVLRSMGIPVTKPTNSHSPDSQHEISLIGIQWQLLKSLSHWWHELFWNCEFY